MLGGHLLQRGVYVYAQDAKRVNVYSRLDFSVTEVHFKLFTHNKRLQVQTAPHYFKNS